MHTIYTGAHKDRGLSPSSRSGKVNSQDVVRLYGQHVPVAPHAVEVRLNAINWFGLRGGDCPDI